MHSVRIQLKVGNNNFDVLHMNSVYTFFFLLSASSACGTAVYRLLITMGKSSIVIPSPKNCIHFLRRLWVRISYYTRVIPRLYPQKNSRFYSIKAYLYPLSTAPTINTTNKIKYIIKTI